MNQKFLAFFLITGIIIKNTIQGIIIPIIAETFKSLNFILLTGAFQFVIIFGTLYVFLHIKNKEIFKLPEQKLLIVVIGIFNAIMALLMMYSANPERTPVIMQTILAGLPVLPTFALRKIFLNKLIIYNKWLIACSMVFILASLGFAVIPLVSQWSFKSIGWILMFAGGIFFQGAYNVLQEKYTSEVDTNKLVKKIGLIFYVKIVEFIVLVAMCWLEYFIGYGSDPLNAFKENAIDFIHNYKSALLLEGFIIAYVLAYLMSVYLNSISSNYNMITPVISNPLIAIFFTVFSQFNNGVHYALWIVISCIICSITGVVLWIMGEKITEYIEVSDDIPINDETGIASA